MAHRGAASVLDLQKLAEVGAEAAFDRITALAADLFDVPVALTTFVDDETQWIKAKVGVDFCSGSRRDSFCRHVIDDPSHAVLVVEDLSRDPRFADNVYVVREAFRFYAGAPLLDAAGACIGTLCILDYRPRRGLTPKERMRLTQLAGLIMSELELRQLHRVSEERRHLLALAESMVAVGHWRYALKDDWVVWSDEIYRIHGVDPESYNPNLTGGIDFYLPEDRIKVVEGMQRAVSSKTGFEFELRIRRADGQIRTVVSRAVCELDPRGEVAAVFGVFQDVTEQRANLDALTRARESAEAATVAKAAFLADMSHELRTPLNSILGFSEMLRTGVASGSEARSHIDQIEDAGRHLLGLIDDVLDFARLDSGRMEMRARPFSPWALASTALDMMAPQAERRGLLLRLEAPPDTRRSVMGDPDRLRQVLLNLLANAIKFTAVGSVTLRLTARDGERVALSFAVADTGPGIAPERVDLLFQRFERLDTVEAGTGLGLAISKSIMEAMGGRLMVRSRVGEGSVFTASVDLAPAADASPDGAAPAPSAGGTGARRILVAEDLAMNRELVRVMLLQVECRIDFARDGEECLRQVQSEDYALILMDVQMPKLDGIGAARIIRSLGGRLGRIPILALTADTDPGTLQACREAGMSGHITKPIAKRDLEAKVREWLDRSARAAV